MACDNYTDVELLRLLQQNSEDAYTALFHRFNSLLYIHAYKKLQDPEEAKDVVQDVFTMLWQKRMDIPQVTNLAGYLYTCVHHKILDKFSQQQSASKYIRHLQQYLDTTDDHADGRARENQLAVIIEQEIAALPPKMREVFELSRKQHLSHKEIAEQLSISQETVKSQVKNALRVLRSKLDRMMSILFF